MQKEEKIKKHQYKVLDKGFVKLVDYMGSDQSIENAARISYGKGTRKTSETRILLRYLMRHKHTSPFEMGEIALHVKLPIFVARQWIRHRTANVNEMSGRYSEMTDDFYNPCEFRKQSKDNKQGSGFGIIAHDIQCLDKTYTEYLELINKNVSREMARIVLPLATYTEWTWKIDLHNLMHFLKLRLDTHAQEEIRKYAEFILLIVKDLFPITCEAFEDYVLNSVTFSSQEKEIISKYIREGIFDKHKMTKRETTEFKGKMLKMGIKI